ncbi:Signal transduction histidine kinase [Hahella chejuensis KCTC 2396]|uniref:histidine kinase n=1 Tax=Hahella chejuensis (strain KCTC 2396) TaxID=349521 RepID=Q2SJ16_HAHCH|nr:ATP-binding protein [Hahella chejuensis]ABC29358.1 Signal transduction histidine kinase [Hahella chejuensis KCTC 2396]
MKWSQMPIKHKLIMMTLFTSVIGIVVVSLSFIWYENLTYKDQLKQEMNVIGKILADRSNAALVFSDTAQLQDNVNSLKLRQSIELSCIYDAMGAPLSSFSRRQDLQCPLAPAAHEGEFTSSYFHLTQAIELDGESIGKLYIRSSLQELVGHLQNYIATAAIVSALVVMALLLVSSMLQRIISTPLVHLTETATRIARVKDYSLRAEQESEDEIGQLVVAFNSMLDTIEEQNAQILHNYENLEKIVAQRTAELRSANKELEAFSYSVSHDLRQPLRAIDGFSDALLEDCSDQLDEVAMDYLNRVRAASQRMGRLIDSMLTLSRVTRYKVESKEVNLSNLAATIFEALQADQPERHVEAVIQPGLMTQGDENLLGVALSNLIGNAWKYSSKLSHARIEFGAIDKDGERIFYVKDNGAGFDMKYADKLFVAFNRLHSPAEFEGSGIGLATVSRVISRHGGRIWAESQPGEGSVFYFTLNDAAVDAHETGAR